MHLLRHITQKTACPNCQQIFFPEQVRIDISTDDTAFLTIHCQSCQHDLHAYVIVNFADPEIADGKDNYVNEISLAELENAEEFLRQYNGDISGLFSKSA